MSLLSMLSSFQYSQVLDAFPCLRAVTPEEWAESQPAVRAFPAKSCVFQRGEGASYGLFLLKGTARISRIGEDGDEAVISMLQAGDVCGLLVLSGLSDRDYPGTITAESEVEALFVTKQSFLGWLQAHVEIRNAVFGGLLDNLLRISEQSGGRRPEPLNARLVKALLRPFSEGKPTVRMTHRELAVEIGSSREVVSRALQRYRQQGWIEMGRGWIRIVRKEELTALVGQV